ncbi:MAG: UDP-N-acetylglucosamine pyrophosphorylase [Ruminococcaceae bacterium]|nr:UDP-N-acetylglucosamine pyrophosphorylase [Oscillospiraceae bacterium]
MTRLEIGNLFDITNTIASDIFEGKKYAHEVLPEIKEFIKQLSLTLDTEKFDDLGGGVFVAKSAKVASSASITGPCIIDEEAEIRHCAFIRGNVIVGKGAVVGNSTELKNAILFDKVQVPHYNYVGDSILGYKSHLGAGAITSNVKSDKTNVSVTIDGKKYNTNLKKFGAILGDCVEVGCGTVLNPGTVVGKNTNIYPLSMVRGYVPQNSIYKNRGEIVEKIWKSGTF